MLGLTWIGAASAASAGGGHPAYIPRVTGDPMCLWSVRPKGEPLPFRQMTRGHHHEVAVVERRHLPNVEALGQGDDAGVNRLETEGGVGRQQLGHAPVVMRRHLDDTQLVRADCGAEAGGQAGTAARCGSDSRWQISVTARDGTTSLVQF